MNERIEKLAEQSVSRFDKDMDGSMEPTENGRWVYYDDLTEFAELIVRECLGCCEQVISDPVPENVDTWLNGGSQCIDEIKEHFRVEE